MQNKYKLLLVLALVIIVSVFFIIRYNIIKYSKNPNEIQQIETPSNEPDEENPENIQKTPESAPVTLEQAISIALKEKTSNFRVGELPVEGHIILESQNTSESQCIVYAIASWGYFGFENGIFTKISGTGATPIVLTLSVNQAEGYKATDLKQPMDGSYYDDSIKEMFPEHLLNTVLTESNAKYPELLLQQENQAKDYLKTINRDAQVNGNYIDKEPLNIGQEASDLLLGELAKNDTELNKFPFWIGNVEIIENNVRYIYETSKTLDKAKNILLTYTKKDEKGKTLLQYRFIIDSQGKLKKI